MDTRFLPHNTHREGPLHFSAQDPQLRRLKRLAYAYTPDLLAVLPDKVPGIYSITGGRQIGKTTLLKQWMEKLLKEKVNPQAIIFVSGELIDDYHTLLYLLQTELEQMPAQALRFFIIDEITYIRDWDKAVKYAADAGWLDDVVLMLTGSDSSLIQEARVRFPGRRGKADGVNFHLYPLSFREVVQLKNPLCDMPSTTLLYAEWNNYLLHGGYLTAMNDMAEYGIVLPATLATYSDWIRGDMLRRGKQGHYLREVLGAVIKRYTSQITWNALAKDLSIDHPHTVADYIALLESMDAVFVQSALLEDKLLAAPKKAKKVIFCDPFIFHAIRAWLFPVKNPFQEQMQPIVQNPDWCGKLVEAATVSQYRRFFPTYYIKAEGEIDIAYLDGQRIFPIEIKWTNQLHVKDLKQVMKYPNSKILTKNNMPGEINHIPTIPLPLALWQLIALE
jgi:hypothetical protein